MELGLFFDFVRFWFKT